MSTAYSQSTTAVLELLAVLQPMTFENIMVEACQRGLSEQGVSQAIGELANDYLVERLVEPPDLLSRYSITVRGRAKVLAAAARNAFAADNDDPIEVRCCRRREPEPPAVATVCLAEDELDDWWTALDVDCKASLFVDHSLLHAIDDRRIPVVGTIGTEERVAAE